MRCMTRFTVLMVILVAAGAAWGDNAQQLNDRGLQQMEAGKYEGAVNSFNSARAQMPRDPVVQHNLAMAYNAWGVEFAKTGRFLDALSRLNTARSLAPGEAAIPRNIIAIRINWATVLTEGARYEDAESQLRQAAQDASDDGMRREIAKRRAYNTYMVGKQLLEQGDRDRGRARIEAAIQMDPNCTHALVKLAEIQYEAGQTTEAVENWKRASAVDPTIDGLDQMLTKAEREASVESSFNQRSTRQFNVAYEGSVNEQAAREAMQILSRGLFQIGRDLKYEAKGPIAVVLYQRDQYEAATTAPTWSAGLYDGKIRVPLRGGNMGKSELAAMTRTLRHELTHAVVNDIAPKKVPAWLNEGLAMYYELDDAERNQRAQSDRRKIVKMIRQEGSVSVLELPSSFTEMNDQEQVERAYLLSRQFVHWMADRWRPWKFKDLLAELGEGTPFEDAVEKVYRVTPEQMEKMWVGGMK